MNRRKLIACLFLVLPLAIILASLSWYPGMTEHEAMMAVLLSCIFLLCILGAAATYFWESKP